LVSKNDAGKIIKGGKEVGGKRPSYVGKTKGTISANRKRKKIGHKFEEHRGRESKKKRTRGA